MPSGAALRRSPVVVGREAELDLLHRLVRDARKGETACVVLLGEGGIGKTRLVTEVTTVARRLGMPVLESRAPVTTPAPFSLLAPALRRWVRTTGDFVSLGPYDLGMSRVLPEWPAEGRLDLDDAQARLLALEAVVQLLRRAAVEGGALLVVDDIHGADAESIEAIRYAVDVGIPGLATVLAMRPGEHAVADGLVRVLQRDLGAEVVSLAPLDERAVTALVAALLDASAPEPLVADVLARTDGVPLLVEEIVLAHVRADTVAHGGRANVPRTVRDLADGRLQLLAPAHRNVIVAGAVIGDFEPSLMRDVAATDDATLAEGLAGGVRVGVLESSDGVLVFRHAIIRDAVLDAAVPHLVDTMHRRAIDALEARASADIGSLTRLAYHLQAIGDSDRSAEARSELAALERDDNALLAAEDTARQAVALATEAATRERASDTLASILVAQGRWSDALAQDEVTVAMYGDTAERRIRIATAAVEIGRPETAEPLIARALDDGDRSPPVLLLDGRLAVVRGDGERALARATEILDTPSMTIDDRLLALDLRARALDFLGDRSGAEEAWTRQAREAESTGRTQARLRAVVQLGKLELFSGRPPQRLREAVDLARSAGALVELGWAQENLAIGLALQGEMVAAREVFDDAIARCRALRLDQLAYLIASRGMSESYLSEEHDADLDEADRMLPSVDLQLHTTMMRGDIALRAGRYDDAITWLVRCDELMQAMPGAVPLDAPGWLVWAFAAAGRRDEALLALDRARQLPDLDRWFGRPIVLAAGEAMLAGDADRLDDLFVEVDSRMPLDVALMRQLSASIMPGQWGNGWLRASLDSWEAAGATLQAERVRRLLRDAGGSVPRRRTVKPVPGGLADHGVTAREAEVLHLLGDGLPNADIAARLFVSVRTVEAHVSSLLTKLDARTRAQLAGISTTTDWSV